MPVWDMEEDMQQELGRQRMERRELARQVRTEQETGEEDERSKEGT